LLLEEQALELAAVDPTLALEVTEQLLSLLKSENCIPWSIRFLPGAHFTAYMIANELGRKKLARNHLQKANEIFVSLQGASSPESLRTQQLLR
jgi:hypothetical protein